MQSHITPSQLRENTQYMGNKNSNDHHKYDHGQWTPQTDPCSIFPPSFHLRLECHAVQRGKPVLDRNPAIDIAPKLPTLSQQIRDLCVAAIDFRNAVQWYQGLPVIKWLGCTLFGQILEFTSHFKT